MTEDEQRTLTSELISALPEHLQAKGPVEGDEGYALYKEVVNYKRQGDWRGVAEGNYSVDTDTKAKALLAEFAKDEEFFKQLEQIAQLQEIQLPRESMQTFEGAKFKEALQMLHFRTRANTQLGRFEPAIKDTETQMRLSSLYLRGHGGFIQNLVGLAMRAIACRGVMEVALASDAEWEHIEVLQTQLNEEIDLETQLLEMCRTELIYIIEVLVADQAGNTSDQIDIELLPWTIFEMFPRGKAIDLSDEDYDQIQAIAKELEKHPNLYNAKESSKSAAKKVDEFLGLPGETWLERKQAFETLEQNWRDRVPELFTNPDFDYKSREQCTKGLKEAMAFSNPIGELSVITLLEVLDDIEWAFVDRECQRRLSKIVLALRLHEMEHGELPDSLNDLEDRQYLEILPLDPYVEKPFYYSKERRAVWSVGKNGKNDNGIFRSNLPIDDLPGPSYKRAGDYGDCGFGLPVFE